MFIYHYSNAEIKDNISQEYFAINSYSNHSRNLSNVKRIYFYRKLVIPEIHLINCKYKYIAKINKNKLYNIDSNKIISQDIYAEVKKQGYIGLYNAEQVILFYSVKIFKKINLTS